MRFYLKLTAILGLTILAVSAQTSTSRLVSSNAFYTYKGTIDAFTNRFYGNNIGSNTVPFGDIYLTGASVVGGNALVSGSLAGNSLVITNAAGVSGALTANSGVVTTTLSVGTGFILGGGASVTKILSATGTLDFGSIASQASEDLTITVTGAAVGNSVFPGLPAAPAAGIVFNTFVSAPNTVTVRAMNYSAAPVDPASASYRATVFSY